jgi:hypothetical protein
MRHAQGATSFLILLWAGFASPALAQATNSVKCDDGSTVTVSTGTNGGACGSVSGSAWISCGDGASGSSAAGGCIAGKAQCGERSQGGGSCTIKAAVGNQGSAPKKIPIERQPVNSGVRSK